MGNQIIDIDSNLREAEDQASQCNIFKSQTFEQLPPGLIFPFQPRRSLGLPGGSAAKVFEARSR